MNKAALAGMLIGAILFGIVLGAGGTVAAAWVGKAIGGPSGPAMVAQRAQFAGGRLSDDGGPPWADGRSSRGGSGMMGRGGTADGPRGGYRPGDADGAGSPTCPDCGYTATDTPAPRPFFRR